MAYQHKGACTTRAILRIIQYSFNVMCGGLWPERGPFDEDFSQRGRPAPVFGLRAIGLCGMCALSPPKGGWVVGSAQGPGQPLPVKGTLAVWSADLEAITDLLGFWRWNKTVAPCWLAPSSLRNTVNGSDRPSCTLLHNRCCFLCGWQGGRPRLCTCDTSTMHHYHGPQPQARASDIQLPETCQHTLQ